MEKYKYWLASLKDLGNAKKHKLEEYFKSPREVYHASEKKLKSVSFLEDKEADYIKSNARPEILEDYFRLRDLNVGFVHHKDDFYPAPLQNIHDKPYALFYKGNLPKDFSHGISIVGSRRLSVYGRLAAEDISDAIAKNGGLIISGMARGIDSAGHSGAIKNNQPTVAVLGCGVDVCYPKENKNLYRLISENGCILSEYPIGTPPLPLYFPMRNRIISGLCRALIVIEAASRSGSLITADFALDQGKDIYALPGRINDPLSKGTNHLIEQGADIITGIDELISALRERAILPRRSQDNKSGKKTATPALLPNEKLVMQFVEYEPVSLDDLLLKTELPLVLLLEAVTTLATKDIIRETGKNKYVKNMLD